MSNSETVELFAERFGCKPEWLVQAPGRINLIGEHIDYLNGLVMPAAIDRYVRMTVRENGTERITVWSDGKSGSFGWQDLKPFKGADYWMNYIGGVVEMYRREGIEVRGFDAVITADLPVGAGLSSSAALETATAFAVETVAGVKVDPTRRAELCRAAEHEFAGVPCGIMDQIAVGFGQKDHALMVDCSDASISPVKIPAGISLLVSDTRVSHALGDGEYRKRSESCDEALLILEKPGWREVSREDLSKKESELGSSLFRRARHVISELNRVPAMKDALVKGDLESVSEIMKSGHESLRDDYEVSCRELDLLVKAAYEFGFENGRVGSRMTGGGFGGSTVTLVREDSAEALKAHLESRFRAEFGSEPNCFITPIADGASVNSIH
ncbi:galactokinase [Verrucomicrobiales bacterium]|nr:galactokinase [Verrucomicrobiales bacterium]